MSMDFDTNYDSKEIEDLGVTYSTLKEFSEHLAEALELLREADLRVLMGDVRALKEARVPIYISGKPGISKSARVESAVREINKQITYEENKFDFKKIQLGQTEVGEFSSIPLVINGKLSPQFTEKLPVQDKDAFLKDPNGKVLKDEEGNPIPNPDYHKYGVLFFDELSSADTHLVQPVLGLCDESRTINSYKLPEHWLVVGAGNGPDCNNFVKLDTMTISRFRVFDIQKVNFERDFREFYLAQKVHPLIVAYLDTHPDDIMFYDSRDYTGGQTTDSVAGKQSAVTRNWTELSDVVNNAVRGKQLMAALEQAGIPLEEATNPKYASKLQDIKQNFIAETKPADVSVILKHIKFSINKEVEQRFRVFVDINAKSKIKPEDILAGTAKAGAGLTGEVAQTLINYCCRMLNDKYEQNDDRWSKDSLQQVKNYLHFFESSPKREYMIMAIIRIKELPEMAERIADEQEFPGILKWVMQIAEDLTHEDITNYTKRMCSAK